MNAALGWGAAAAVASVLVVGQILHLRRVVPAGRGAGGAGGRPRETGGPRPGPAARLARLLGSEEEAAARRRELAAWLDLLILEVEAGVGLRQAVEEASRQARGRLRPVLEAVLRDLGMGATLVEAVASQSAASGLGEEWRFLVRGLRLGQRFGTPVAESLRQLAGDIRRRQRQDLELKMNLLPVKLGLVGLLFFFPPLLVLLVLPNVLQFLRSPW